MYKFKYIFLKCKQSRQLFRPDKFIICNKIFIIKQNKLKIDCANVYHSLYTSPQNAVVVFIYFVED